MPTYDFECPDCGAAYEAFLSYVRFDEPQMCPEGCEVPGHRQIGRGAGFTVRGGRSESDPLKAALADRAGAADEIDYPFDLETKKKERRAGKAMEAAKKRARQNERDARSLPGRRKIQHVARIPHAVYAHQVREHGKDVFTGDEGLQRARDLGYGLGN